MFPKTLTGDTRQSFCPNSPKKMFWGGNFLLVLPILGSSLRWRQADREPDFPGSLIGFYDLRHVGREGDALFVLWCVFTTKTVIFNWNFHEKSLNANFPSYRKENGVSSSWKNSVSCGSTRKKCGVNFSQKWVWHDRRGDFDFLKVWTEKRGWYGFDFFKIRIGGKGKVERSAICYLLMQRTVKFVAVEKLNMRAVFAVSVGDEKKARPCIRCGERETVDEIGLCRR